MGLIEMYFTQLATITPFVREGDAEPVYGEAETRKCRMERGRHLVSGGAANGTTEQIVANAKMFCVGDPIPTRSLVQCDGQEFVVLSCDIMRGFADHHLEVYLE